MGIERRLEKLEQAAGGGGCDTCSGWFVVVVNGKLDTKNPPRRYGRPVSVEEYLRFRHTADAASGKCPECGCEQPDPIRVVGLEHTRAGEQ
jgi:hypothetical protein